MLDGVTTVDSGVTAGASAPETLVAELVERLEKLGAGSVEELGGLREDVVFNLPKKLR